MTQQIAVGARVLLRFAPHGEPGLVIAQHRGGWLVRWADLDMEARHAAEDLTLLEGEQA